ncbi:hypothetical protein ABZW02_20280 [Streptomyces sp. NPDC005180]|uniref:hypothetical protein n=1 Tax=Streptomyces sp. NPDC005180 TaxID=3156868 RepID=UPI0033B34112
MNILARLRTALRRRLSYRDTLADAPTREETDQLVQQADQGAAQLPTARSWKKRGAPTVEEIEHALVLREQARALDNAGARLQRRTDALLRTAVPGQYGERVLTIETDRLRDYRVADLVAIIERHGLEHELPRRERADDLVRVTRAEVAPVLVAEPLVVPASRDWTFGDLLAGLDDLVAAA